MLVALGAFPARAMTTEFSDYILVAVEGPRDELVETTERSTTRSLLRSPASRIIPLFDTEPRHAATRREAGPTATRRWVAIAPSSTVRAAPRTASAAGTGWDVAHDIVDGKPPPGYGELGRTLRSAGRVRIAEIEPDVRYVDTDTERVFAEAARAVGRAAEPRSAKDVVVDGDASGHWPGERRFGWHLEDGFSQLRAARDEVGGIEGDRTDRVTIAHLDTGYGKGQARPPHLDEAESYDFTVLDADGRPSRGGFDRCDGGLIDNCGHGTGTLSILAGDKTVLSKPGYPAFDDYIGAAPQARVVEYRISESVVHLWPRTMATAIEYASRHDVDVVSMSMGGAPLALLRDAVNDAYMRGTALFTAAGNYFTLPVLGIRSPVGTVYPAAFDRVVAVTGVTGKGTSYTDGPSLWSLLVRGDCSNWMMRGNSGPRFAMNEAIAAYTPNVEWMVFDATGPGNHIRLNGAGTSAATPQAAGAAALWLQRHRGELTADWRTWRKTEAVYRAILDSAGTAGQSPEYVERYFGAGVLRAHDALARGVPNDLRKRPEATIRFLDFVLVLMQPPTLRDAEADDRRALHAQMLAVEVAQLVYGSRELQEIVGDRTPEALATDREARTRLAGALKRDPNASTYLRGNLREP
jgi:subtilisin family serine protease